MEPAVVHPRGVKGVINVTGRPQDSGVGCQVSASEFDPLDRSRPFKDILSTVLAFRCTPISVQDSVITDICLRSPLERGESGDNSSGFDLRQCRLSLT